VPAQTELLTQQVQDAQLAEQQAQQADALFAQQKARLAEQRRQGAASAAPAAGAPEQVHPARSSRAPAPSTLNLRSTLIAVLLQRSLTRLNGQTVSPQGAPTAQKEARPAEQQPVNPARRAKPRDLRPPAPLNRAQLAQHKARLALQRRQQAAAAAADTPADSAAPQQDVGTNVAEAPELDPLPDPAPRNNAPANDSSADDQITRNLEAPSEAPCHDTGIGGPTSNANIDISNARGTPGPCMQDACLHLSRRMA